MNGNFMNYAMQMLSNSPNPMAREAIDALRTGNNAKGEEIANNLLKSMGMTKEQAVKKANSIFKF